MRHSPPAFLLALFAALPVAVSAQAAPVPAARPKPAQLPADSMQLARKYAIWLYTASADSLMAHMDSASKAQPDVLKMIENGSAQLAASAGTEEKVLEEKFITRNGIIFELNGGVLRNVITSKDSNLDIFGRFAISVGYRF